MEIGCDHTHTHTHTHYCIDLLFTAYFLCAVCITKKKQQMATLIRCSPKMVFFLACFLFQTMQLRNQKNSKNSTNVHTLCSLTKINFALLSHSIQIIKRENKKKV